MVHRSIIMPKVLISSIGFETSIIDEIEEVLIQEFDSISRSVDGNVPVILAESDMKMNTVINVEDSVYNTTFTRTGDSEVANYTTRKDFVGENVIYTGEAAVGSTDSAAVWRIYKLEFINAEGDIKETWADATDEFTKVWNDRLSYTYL